MPASRPRASATALLVLVLAGLAAATAAPVRAQDPPRSDRDEEIFRRDMVLFEPFERTRKMGELVTLEFRVQRGYHTPVLVVVFPDGTPLYQYAQSLGAGRYNAFFRCDGRGGNHRVSLVVDSDRGDLMAAQFFVRALDRDGKEVQRDIEIPPEDTVYPPMDEEEDPLRIERMLFHRMNGFRRSQGLAPLPWHEGVARAAREHMPDLARYYEETFDERIRQGKLAHEVPGAGRDGGIGPSIADRVRVNLAWPVVIPKLPPDNPKTGRGQPNYISETLTSPASSMDWKFEQVLLRKSDLRAPMQSAWTTHAAGAAIWRTYEVPGKRDDGAPPPAPDPSAPPATAPRDGGKSGARGGHRREAIAALVFVQVNDPECEKLFEKETRGVLSSAGRGRDADEKAASYRLLGQYALPEGGRILRRALGDRDPRVAAGALDGLWLSDPDEARGATDSLRVRLVQAAASGDWSKAAPAVETLRSIRYDAASRRDGEKARAEVGAAARTLLNAVDEALAAGRIEEAKAGFEDVKRRFEGFPEAEEAQLGLRELLASDAWKNREAK